MPCIWSGNQWPAARERPVELAGSRPIGDYIVGHQVRRLDDRLMRADQERHYRIPGHKLRYCRLGDCAAVELHPYQVGWPAGEQLPAGAHTEQPMPQGEHCGRQRGCCRPGPVQVIHAQSVVTGAVAGTSNEDRDRGQHEAR